MKKIIMIASAFACILFFTAFIVNTASVPKANMDPKPIPADVMKIAEKSCVKCHTEPGESMALMHLNLSNWDKYSAEKQAAKAKDMCKMVTKGKMPPKKFRKNNPDGVPSKDEVTTICNWAASLEVPKK
jgi:hypothetical protein